MDFSQKSCLSTTLTLHFTLAVIVERMPTNCISVFVIVVVTVTVVLAFRRCQNLVKFNKNDLMFLLSNASRHLSREDVYKTFCHGQDILRGKSTKSMAVCTCVTHTMTGFLFGIENVIIEVLGNLRHTYGLDWKFCFFF